MVLHMSNKNRSKELKSKWVHCCGVVTATMVLSACGGGGSGDAPSPPTITTQAQSQSVSTDATAAFSVTAAGTGLTYQWQKDGVAIAGATGSTYTTPPVTYSDSGAAYTVVVSNAGGSVTSNAVQLTLKLSANQQAFEDLILAPSAGSHHLSWDLNFSGPETSGINYAWSDFATLTLSPLTKGPQKTTQSAPVNMTSTLALTLAGPTRILRNGTILVVPATQSATAVSYVGDDVRVDYLAADNTTVAWSQIRTGYSTVSLTGLLAGSTDDFAHYHNSFYSNSAILNPAATYQAGSAYVKYTAIVKGDRYTAFDCAATTTDANITPCRTGMTLAAALTAGIASVSDGVTYLLSDGAVSTVGGIPVWVATATRPVSATLSATPQYRAYFELNGNVYAAVLIKDGALLGGSYYVSNPGGATVTDRLTFLPFNLRMNKAARDSVAAALTI